MSLSLTQDHRPVRLETPFGKDVLNLVTLSASEGMSETFVYDIEAVSTQAGLDFDQALGRNCCVTYRTHEGAERHFNGVLTAAEWLGKRGDLHHYRLKLEPWFALLNYTSDCRFFQNMSVTAIIRKVFSDSGFSDFVFRTEVDYKDIEYCVQYRESNFTFVSRLMEKYGIYYFFESSKDKHEMVLADGKSCHKPVKHLATVPFTHEATSNYQESQYLNGWKPTRSFQSGKVALNDYNYLKPNTEMLAKSAKPGQYAKSDLEVYDYHGHYDERGDGEAFAKIRIEARQALDFRRQGSGDAPSLVPGGLVTLKDHQESSENRQYLVLSTHHHISSAHYLSGGDGEDSYSGHYLFQPADRAYRAPLITRRPQIAGLQTAKVVGKEGEEIDVDEHGRILVQFHWDRDKKQSRRVRVAQNWAGNNWGGIVIPRIDMEVVVEFVEGDPDCPLVTGAVYNGKNKTPYTLPDNKTISGVKSRSSKGDNGFNELTLDDKKDQEKIFVHGEKDLDIKIKNTETREIGCEFKPPREQVSRDTTIVNGDDRLTVEKGNQKIKIGASQTIDVTEVIKISAGILLELKVGASKITMTAGTISIESPVISINGMAMLNLSAPVTNISGAGALNLSGALVKIN